MSDPHKLAADPAALLSVVGLGKKYGDFAANNNIDLGVRHGEIHVVIGPNGAGKTTLVGQLAGEVAPSAGRIYLDGRDITALVPFKRARLGVARTFQISSVFQKFSALENVAIAAQAHAGHSFRFWRRVQDDHDLNKRAMQALDSVGLADRAKEMAVNLAHGEQRGLELAMALVTRPRLLLLDEPAAGMGPEESYRLVRLLKTLKSDYAIFLVEHDMELVFSLADRITVLVAGEVLARGAPETIRQDAAVQAAYLGTDDVPLAEVAGHA